MESFILSHYEWFKALHLIAVISWMAGLLYLPRLFVYHADAKGDEMRLTLKTMECRLLRFIMNPAMVATWIFGICLLYANMSLLKGGGWMDAKLFMVVLLTVFHHMLARWRKAFARGENKRTASFYRKINEVPTVLMIGIVIMVIVKPF